MNILLVYPEIPSTFWSFRAALKFISKNSTEPPLGLITVAAMLPAHWEKKLIDMNVSRLTDEHIQWADYLFITGMNIQKNSFKKVVKRSNELNTPVVAGGPMVTTDYREFLGVDHFILNEVEAIFPEFLKDLEQGSPAHFYSSTEFPDLSHSPIPAWELIERDKYAAMSIQYSRGCPYDCEFCSITMLNGHHPRTKSPQQFLAELEALYQVGWRGSILIVDDNFIGNKNKLKKEFLPALIEWSKKMNYPFSFGTETSINLADDDVLIRQMVEAGFNHAFIGIETPHSDSLEECGKKHNLKSNLLDSVKKLQRSGIRVSGGFIIGFDHDPQDIFEQQINFIRHSGIVTAMVGLLNAPTGTRLFKRLQKENRLLEMFSGNNMDGSINFVPRMNYQSLVAGYRKVLDTIYAPREYYQRVKTFLKDYHSPLRIPSRLKFQDFKALFKSFWILGVKEQGRRYYWKLIFLSLFRFPHKFPMAITMAIYGFHFRRVAQDA